MSIINRKTILIPVIIFSIFLSLSFLLSKRQSQITSDGTAGQEYSAYDKEVSAANPFLEGLPYDGYYFRLSYDRSEKSPSNDKAYMLVIYYFDDLSKSRALLYLNQVGIDITTIEVVYRFDQNLSLEALKTKSINQQEGD